MIKRGPVRLFCRAEGEKPVNGWRPILCLGGDPTG